MLSLLQYSDNVVTSVDFKYVRIGMITKQQWNWRLENNKWKKIMAEMITKTVWKGVLPRKSYLLCFDKTSVDVNVSDRSTVVCKVIFKISPRSLDMQSQSWRFFWGGGVSLGAVENRTVRVRTHNYVQAHDINLWKLERWPHVQTSTYERMISSWGE